MKRLFIALLIGLAALLSGCGSSRSSSTQTTETTIVTGSASLPATTIPWTNVGGANPSFDYGHSSAGDGTAPIRIATPTAGAIITLTVTGSATVNGASHAPGDAGPTASTYPGNFISSPKIVVGAFTNGSGEVLNPGGPVSIGSSAAFTVPAGASQLQVGIDSSANTFSANSGNFNLSWSIATTSIPKKVYTVVVTPTQLTLNSGDFTSISAIVYLSENNGTPKVLLPQPALKFFSSDPRVTISPAGEVCAGQWDARFFTCSPTVFGPCTLDAKGIPVIDPATGKCVPNPLAGQLNLPSGFVTVTAVDSTHNVSGSLRVTVHSRAARITLSAPDWAGRLCISQTNPVNVPVTATNANHVQYVASAFDANGNPIHSCTTNPGEAGCINDDDYTWSTESSSVAEVNNFGSVVARNPGVTNVFATLNGTVSEPLAFATCPPSSIVLSTSPFIASGNPAPPFTTDDLTVNKGEQRYLNATLVDVNGNTLTASPLTYIVSDPLAASVTSALPLSAKLSAIAAGRFTVTAACEPPSCNPSVADFISPAGPQSAQDTGFGHPVYSNVIGATVEGINGSTVLVSGKKFSDGTTDARRLLVYDSESLTLIQTVALGNIPNSLVVAPNGAKAYLGSSDGLVVVDLNSFQSSTQTFPIVGQLSTARVTGVVLGVSPDSRYVVVSDTSNADSTKHLVFLIDTTGTKMATEFRIPNITSATFAGDGTNIWIGGDAGVFVFRADTFVPIATNATTLVTSLAWMPDGQSYFASGFQLVDYRACENQVIQTFQSPVSSVPGGLVTTVPPAAEPVPPAVEGPPEISHLLGLDFNAGQWFDYAVTNSAQVPTKMVQTTPSDLIPNPPPKGNVCLSTVNVNTAVTIGTTLPCSATQLSFAPKLQEVFATGVDPACAPDPAIHGYAPFGLPPSFNTAATEVPLTTTNPLVPLSGSVVPLSGGILSDGRKLFYGTCPTNPAVGPACIAPGAVLHRIDLATSTGAPGTLQEDKAVSVGVVPNFVAVVPK